MQVLSKKALSAITRNNKVIGRLVAKFDKHPRTIENWIDNNDVHLTNPSSLEIIREETGLTDEEILTEKQAA